METFISLAGKVTSHLWSVSWQVSILVILIWIVARLSWRASSSFRYWLWCIVLLRLMIPINLSLPFGQGQKIGDIVGFYIQALNYKFFGHTFISHINGELNILENALLTSKLSQIEIAGIFWFFSIFVIGLLILARAYSINRCLKDCSPVQRPDLKALLKRLVLQMGIKHPVQLFYMDMYNINVPAVIGIFRPRILLPPKIINEWSISDIEPILLHELIHIKHYHLPVNWLQVIIQAVYFFHPLVWLANRRIRQIRENVCDDMAIHWIGKKRKLYSENILRAMENVTKEPTFGFIGIGLTEKKNRLRERIKRIMSKNYSFYKPLTVWMIICLVLISIFSISLSSYKITAELAKPLDITIGVYPKILILMGTLEK